MAFNPGLNRVTFGHFEALPPAMRGSMAHSWLATWGMAERMQNSRHWKGLPAVLGSNKLRNAGVLLGWLLRVRSPALRQEMMAHRAQAIAAYPLELNRQVEARNPQALAFADELGMALAALVATLNLAPAESRAAREEWPASQWERWQTVQHIGLGGGVFSGALGQRIYTSACEWMPKLGADVTLTLAPQPRDLMLLGAARAFADGPVAVLDAGHTALKRGMATVQAGKILDLKTAELISTPYQIRNQAELLDILVNAYLQLLAPGHQISQFGLSLSAHLDEQGNIQAHSASASFWVVLVGLPLQATLEQRLSQALGRACQIRVMHEGQAAAHGLSHTDAAILLGTSVGGAFRQS